MTTFFERCLPISPSPGTKRGSIVFDDGVKTAILAILGWAAGYSGIFGPDLTPWLAALTAGVVTFLKVLWDQDPGERIAK